MQLPWASACGYLTWMQIRAAYHRTFFSPPIERLDTVSAEAVSISRKIKRPPVRAACVFLRNNYGFFGVAAGVAGCAAGAAGFVVPAAPAGLAAGADTGLSVL